MKNEPSSRRDPDKMLFLADERLDVVRKVSLPVVLEIVVHWKGLCWGAFLVNSSKPGVKKRSKLEKGAFYRYLCESPPYVR